MLKMIICLRWSFFLLKFQKKLNLILKDLELDYLNFNNNWTNIGQ